MSDIEIEKSGVIHFDYGKTLEVNSENLIVELNKMVEEYNPCRDYNDSFAGKVKIELSFYCDKEKE